jgi:hypothetical protein
MPAPERKLHLTNEIEALGEEGMSDTASLDKDQLRLLIAVQYLNASDLIFEGLKQQHERNFFHFVITLRSFIEYTRRGMWFLCWANTEKLKEARNLTFEAPGSPGIATMDEMINEALGKGRVSHLLTVLPGINEPFLDCLHALTHGNPVSVRMISFGLDKIFDAKGLLARAEVDLGIFRIMLYRRMLGQKKSDIWKMLRAIHDRPADVAANANIAAHQLRESGKLDAGHVTKSDGLP